MKNKDFKLINGYAYDIDGNEMPSNYIRTVFGVSDNVYNAESSDFGKDWDRSKKEYFNSENCNISYINGYMRDYRNTEDFEELYNFIKDVKFDRLGAFSYSKEEGTPASRLPDQIHPMTKKSRYNKIMKLQQEISKENEKKNIGRELEILIEGITPDKKYYVGRSYMDVPDIDGVAYVKNTSNEDLIGKYVKAKVVDVKDYDLILVEK